MAEEKKQAAPDRREAYGIEPLNYVKVVLPSARPVVKPTRKRRTR